VFAICVGEEGEEDDVEEEDVKEEEEEEREVRGEVPCWCS